MKNEIAAVVFFFTKLVRKNDKLGKEAVERFAEKLTVILQEKYENHWYPEKPSKGQAYRFQRVDPDVLKACENSRILYSDLDLPRELTLWVDPCEVCCRYGEKNNAFVVASFQSGDENKDEISKKVTSAVDKVTSDYHSGSSSDEEGRKEAARPARAPEASRPAATPSPLPQRGPATSRRGFGPPQGPHPPPFPPGYPHPGGRSQAYRPGPRAPPAPRGEPRPFWPSPQMAAPPRR
ncbi:protein BTG3 isoform X2 [Ornithorhynchus anatinus]|uniref:protein BTG3 isoform X2 n=1 Tax=Ornithorhynchus anatinus TaxID=9258 RepID=UPI0010A90A30|nr:protein BTG3 isoform X2 [Ornithorhynchus anatinus]